MTELNLPSERISTGLAGLDAILCGGLIRRRSYLVRGGPGTGKTTIGMHFLSQGVAAGEQTLLIALGEPTEQILADAKTLNLNLDHVTVLDLSPTSNFFTQIQTYDIFSPAEVEREPISQQIIEQIQALKPQRVFLDSMTQFRYLAPDPFQFRKQVLSFLRFLVEQEATIVFTSEGSEEAPDDDLQFMSDGVIHLSLLPPGRTLTVTKFRGSDFQKGTHSIRLTHHGMNVFPRLLPGVYRREFPLETIPSGLPDLDELLHGGIERGTVTIFSGPSGVGKTTVGLQIMKEAAGRGERSVVYTFEEEVEVIKRRCDAVGIPARMMSDRGVLSLVKIEPLQLTPDEFANLVRQEAEDRQARIIMIDSVSGYRLSLSGKDLVSHLHALCKYLANVGITVLLINETESYAGEFQASEIGITYLADNFVYFRYFEKVVDRKIEVRKAIGILKKRLSDFEKTLHELEITRHGLRVSQPISGLQNILGGTPQGHE
ncbi:AAA family ATPase [Oculatella sp. LEGE 06141]|uniref:ATPase domain-containing protein n=1 Tax=Oculatella sp. LEGE 06141 TaxID=1828648 RepID=UPI00188225BC|nr:ATPase domain-containing protein [Oculatella sp. LEGE 06141]MBE9177355.1 AAA family ATPase [Oculatella sp. LEGE 06141]